MQLREFSAQTKRKIFDELFAGGSPSQGEFSATLLGQARDLGEPKMGTTHYSPDAVTHEFTYGEGADLRILQVRLTPPERVVYMPVPAWVVENIWQGSIDGTYHFASDAERLLAEFARGLEVGANAAGFGVRPTIGKD